MATRRFTLRDAEAFAALSADCNPIHVDPVAARRLLFGAPVVHGLHVVLWALDESKVLGDRPVRLARLEVLFRQPVRVGERVSCRVLSREPRGPRLQVKTEERLALEIACRIEESGRGEARDRWLPPSPGSCRVLRLEELAQQEGEFDLTLDQGATVARFPRLVALPSHQLAVLLAVSRLVGMECPGLHSLLTSLRLEFGDATARPRRLSYRVEHVDPRFGSLRLALRSSGVKGDVAAALRPGPVAQAALVDLAPRVHPGEFREVRALVVGGSRGLGEVAAKLLAAGGGRVRLTYQKGSDEAHCVVEEIRSAGGEAEALFYDVLGARAEPSGLRGWRPSHLLYFASPYISLNESTGFSARLFRHYIRYYVEGFVRLVETLARRSEALTVFYPSTAAIDETLARAAEYATAKTAGETVCAHLRKVHRGLRIYAPRLPRLLTDRTVSLLPVETPAPADVLLPHLRELIS